MGIAGLITITGYKFYLNKTEWVNAYTIYTRSRKI